MKKDTKIRLSSFLIAGIAVLAGFTYTGYSQAAMYKMQIEYNYQRALDELSDEIGNIDIALQKSLYAGSDKQFNAMASKLWVESAGAKSNIGQLPFAENDLEGVNKFLSQVGEFAIALSNKNALDEDITPQELENLQKLAQCASDLKNKINAMQAEFAQGKLWQGEIERAVSVSAQPVSQNVSITDGFRDMEDGFMDYPTLIYDGPFSDHLLEKTSLMTKDMQELTVEQAKEKAAQYLECDPSELENEQDTDGNLPTYGFYCKKDGKMISVTKKGGIVASILSSRNVAQRNITVQEACDKAQKFLESKGSGKLIRSYYETAENICTVNFAADSNGVVIYTELIKVSVALDNGDILAVDAKGYIMNHKEREKYTPKKGEQEARKIVSKQLTVTKSRLAVIPSNGENEVFCYEFLCKGKNDEQVLVYVNADTLVEEQILILLISEDGTMTM